ncbi:hypothetical protein GSbR_19540 [Geobacter sp. SVR]|nr:hypothetical protein GSVR_34810 [Geobacter sp. SVR]GCF85354.1 hypothetical protein GSbR_19540 [Geobacter sp. SVR]
MTGDRIDGSSWLQQRLPLEIEGGVPMKPPPQETLHEGPVMDKIEGMPRHCETLKPNRLCPYIPLGCTGCKLRKP